MTTILVILIVVFVTPPLAYVLAKSIALGYFRAKALAKEDETFPFFKGESNGDKSDA